MDDTPLLAGADEVGAPPRQAAIRDELALVEEFIRRAQALPHDSKAESLVTAVETIQTRESGSHKVVIFTEALTTQAYLQELLIERTELRDDEITLFLRYQ